MTDETKTETETTPPETLTVTFERNELKGICQVLHYAVQQGQAFIRTDPEPDENSIRVAVVGIIACDTLKKFSKWVPEIFDDETSDTDPLPAPTVSGCGTA